METNIDKIRSEYNEWQIAGRLLKGKAYDYVKSVLEGRDMEQLDIEAQDLTVVYDGGKHSDYAGNPFSFVSRAYIGPERDVLLETEDCDDYEAESLSADQMVALAEAVAKETGLLPEDE